MTDELLVEILGELRSQSTVLEKQFDLLMKIATLGERKPEAPKIPTEVLELMEEMGDRAKGTPMEKTFSNLTNLLKKGKTDGN
jgi:hypothetical protein